MICSYQWLNYTITLEDKEQTFTVTEGPFSRAGHEIFEQDLISAYLSRRQEYFMITMVNSELEQSTDTHAFSKYTKLRAIGIPFRMKLMMIYM